MNKSVYHYSAQFSSGCGSEQECGEVVISERDCITVINRSWSKKRNFGSTGLYKGQFQSPTGIAFTHDNRLLVVDQHDHRVQMFTLEGKFIKSVGQEGNGWLQFSSPQGITVHPSSGKVFIADTHNHRIQVLNNDLTYSHEFGSRGNNGYGLLIRPLVAWDSHGNDYVADSLNKCVQVLTSSRQFIDTLSTDTPPTGIAIDSMNTVYLSNGCTVLVFNCKRQFIKCFKASHMQSYTSFSWTSSGLHWQSFTCTSSSGSSCHILTCTPNYYYIYIGHC